MERPKSHAAASIREAFARVAALRAARAGDAGLQEAVVSIKRLQSQRFAATYADLLADAIYRPAARFFLEQLYGEQDYADRDAQFARIAGSIESLFPRAVAQTAVALAELHAATEGFDHAMALAWLAPAVAERPSVGLRYAAAWRLVGDPAGRRQQLEEVLALGRDLARLTRAPGLGFLLRAMRAPAAAAGLQALQQFLESGFDTFGRMGRHAGAVAHFLATIQAREEAFLSQLFDADADTLASYLDATLGEPR